MNTSMIYLPQTRSLTKQLGYIIIINSNIKYRRIYKGYIFVLYYSHTSRGDDDDT